MRIPTPLALLGASASLFASGLLIAGCGGGGGGGGGGSTAAGATAQGSVRVLLTDAPLTDLSRVSKAEITVELLLLQGPGAAVVSSSSGTAPVPSAGMTTPPPPSTGNGNGNGKNKAAPSPAPSPAPSASAAPVTSGGVATVGSDGGSWLTLFDAAAAGAPKVFNLLDLRGGISAELAATMVPAGKYNKMRIVISAAEIVVDGNVYSTANGNLRIPSAATSGIQLTFQDQDAIDVQPGQAAQLLLDFDLSRSFDYQGPATAPTEFRLDPVIRAVPLANAGSLGGVVTSDNGTPNDAGDDVPLPNVLVSASYNGTVVTTSSDAMGVYVIPGLGAADWDVTFSEVAHVDSTVAAVTISAGQQTTLDVTLARK